MKKPSFLLNTLLWVVAFVLMAAAVIYQRSTGPTYPKRGAITVEGQEWKYRLVRSEETIRHAQVVLPSPSSGVQATLHWRRYPTQDDFTAVQLAFAADVEVDKLDTVGGMVADLPKQPAAGKLEYYLEVEADGKSLRIPEITSETEPGEENIVLRYKDPVPGSVLWPHIIFMIFSFLIGMRAFFAALVDPINMRKLAWFTLFCLTVGGMVLGPIVQKYAFGHYWTGFPYGSDLTDNKHLIQWIVWILACGVIGFKAKPKEGVGRAVVAVAAVVMIGVYLIPHSMRGSELNYEALEQGVDPTDAIGTGEK